MGVPCPHCAWLLADSMPFWLSSPDPHPFHLCDTYMFTLAPEWFWGYFSAISIISLDAGVFRRFVFILMVEIESLWYVK